MKYFMKEYETRYFAGIEFPNGIQLKNNDQKRIPKLWDRFYEGISQQITNQVKPNHVIGLQIYPFDFKEIATYDYFALAETNDLIESRAGIVTKKLRKGKYICFPIQFDDINQEIQRVYKYIKDNKIKVHMGFDYEDYLSTENYGNPEAILNFCLLIEE